MSYYCSISFKHCNSFEEALLTAHKFCISIRENRSLIETIIKNNTSRIPSNWRSFERKQYDLKECFSWWDRDWLHCFFNFRFIFWKKQKLLGLYENEGRGFPLIVDFQNGTDRDYEYKEWLSGNIPYFKSKVNLFKHYTDKKIIDIYNKKWGDKPCCDDIEYYRKESLYTHISDDLHIEDLIFGKKGNFVEFSMSPINNSETNYEFHQILRKYIKD